MRHLNMEMEMRTPILAVAVVFAASAAFGQMAELDQNSDGMASFDEIVAAYPDVTEDQFAEMDTTGDGNLDEDEMTVAIEAGQLVKAE